MRCSPTDRHTSEFGIERLLRVMWPITHGKRVGYQASVIDSYLLLLASRWCLQEQQEWRVAEADHGHPHQHPLESDAVHQGATDERGIELTGD